MSRWIENYESSEFHTKWGNFKESIENYNIEEITDSSTLVEFARLKKISVFIDSYLKLIDPEINKINVLNDPLAHLNNAISEFNSFVSNKNNTHIQRTNNHIDNCIIHLKNANILIPKISARSVSVMITEYSKTIEKSLREINLSESEEAATQIKLLKNELIGDETSIESKIRDTFNDIEKKYKAINEFYNETLVDESEYKSTKTEILTAKKSIFDDIKIIKESITEATNELDELEKFYIKIYGKLDENKEKRIDGLKQELDKRLTSLTEFETKQKNKYEALIKEIESLLPSATSVGLAEAYHQEREKFNLPIILWNIIFIVSLIGITTLSFITLKDLNTLDDIGKSILHSLPITVPLIWLAIYASKRRSENQRLEQEYAHKEALAKSYSSYKKQIEELNKDDATLLVKLLDSAIQTISYNASESLDKKHGDGTVLNEIVANVKELKKIVIKGGSNETTN
ncbi:MAG: hypothetical protein RBR07_08895 [Arcobacteraceae bacterium]|nr:hypothetical protein [Arcobacteraceae bacterium]